MIFHPKNGQIGVALQLIVEMFQLLSHQLLNKKFYGAFVIYQTTIFCGVFMTEDYFGVDHKLYRKRRKFFISNFIFLN